MALAPAFKERIDALVTDNNVVLFMKGNRRMPQCGFSSRVVGILDGIIDEYETVDVLSDPEVRSGMKEYSDWPTFPQLYVGGELVGGCDIITEMAGTGELHTELGVTLSDVDAPEITLTPAAAVALKEALGRMPEGDFLRFRIAKGWQYELNLGPRTFGDVEVTLAGYTILMDRATAEIAPGTVIDFESSKMGAGFKITNPGEPAPVKQTAAADIKAMIDAGTDFLFYDVRTPSELATARIEGARHFDEAAQRDLSTVDRGTTLVFHCHRGMRSQQAAEHFRQQGFEDVHNMAGGIDAWSKQVDSSVPTY